MEGWGERREKRKTRGSVSELASKWEGMSVRCGFFMEKGVLL